jgi:carboxyl-terminal processing protease
MNLLETIFCFVLVACFSVPAAADDELVSNLSSASFDTIWQTVNENHYDSTFGGVDWKAIHARYDTLMRGIRDDADFMRLMNEMLLELGLSHYAVFRTEHMAASGSPLLSEGGLGLDIRLLDDRAVVSSVTPEFPSALAGLQPGFVIESINGIPTDSMIEEATADLPPHLNERGRLNTVADKIANRFFGAPGTQVKLGYRDAADSVAEITIQMKARPGKTILSDDFPPLFVDFAVRRLDGDIGYVRFSAFLPPVDERFIATVDSMAALKGLIIDIRGNPGGSHEIGEAIASKLIQEETLFSVFRYRDRTDKIVLQPNPPLFGGPVVILIDVMNGSASERFSACMQSIGRAVIIGEQSPGLVGPSEIKALPNGASFMFLVAQSLTPDGTVLEGHGVIPDIAVGLDREALLRGVDTQLERAKAYLEGLSE